MNQVQIFENPAFGQVRTIEERGNVLFCGSDVAKALGYSRPNDAISQHCRSTVKHRIATTQGNAADFNFIPEGDLYRLIVNSKLPAAEKFERWVFDEVLPTIRKTGGYVANDDLFISTYLPNADDATRALFQSTLAAVKNLNGKIEADKPKVLFADAVSASRTSILVGELAKILKQNGVLLGQNRLFTWLRENGFLIKRKGTDYNMPTQKSMELGLFEIKETSITHSDGHISVSKTPKITGKGQQYFINKLLGDCAEAV